MLHLENVEVSKNGQKTARKKVQWKMVARYLQIFIGVVHLFSV